MKNKMPMEKLKKNCFVTLMKTMRKTSKDLQSQTTVVPIVGNRISKLCFF